MINVLYVDDEPEVLDAARSYLEKRDDMIIDPVGSGQAALDKLKVFNYDAIVASYQMSELNGLDFLREIRERGNRTPFIMFTAQGDEEVATEALANGADHYLSRRGNGREDFAELEQVIRRLVLQRCNDKSTRHVESSYKCLLNKMHDGFIHLSIIANEKGKPIDAMILEVNDAFERLSGAKREEVVGSKMSDAIHIREGFDEQFGLAVMKVAETATDTELEGYSPSTNKWFLATVYSSEPGSVAVVMSDTTEGRRLAEDLEQSRELHRRLFDDFPNPVWKAGKDGERTYVNPAWLKITGGRIERELGDGWLDSIHPEDKERCLATYLEALQAKQPFEMEYRLRSKDDYVWILDTGRPFYDANGDFSGFIGTCYDITNRKRDDDVLQLANKKLKILGSITRHDLLNQLTALTGYIGIVQERLSDPALNNYLAKAMHASNNIKKYLEFGRDYEKMGTNRPEWQTVQESFNKGVSTVQLGEISLVANLESIEVFADQMFERVFHNLLDNACRHGGLVKNVTFDYFENEDGLVISCEDDGIGIVEEKHDKLFSNRYGHGLYLVQEILSITGMTIKEVGAQGSGARFEIQVPKGSYRFMSS